MGKIADQQYVCSAGRSKRTFLEYNSPGSNPAGEQCGCEEDPSQGVSQKKPNLEVFSLPVAQRGFERTIPYDVSALRKAAAAAVAEFNGPVGPTVQLTEPDNAHEVTTNERSPQGTSNNPRGRSPSRRPEWEFSGEQKERSPKALHGQLSDLSSLQQDNLGNVFTQRGCPPHGAKAICGRRPRMEDAFTAVPFLLEVPVPASKLAESEIVPARIAPQLKGADASPKADGTDKKQDFETLAAAAAAQGEASAKEGEIAAGGDKEGEEPYLETLHFFGVFDGHGGAEAALHCAQTLHQRIAEALAAHIDPEVEEHMAGEGIPAILPSVDEEDPESSSEHLDEEGDGKSDSIACTSASFESAFTSAFNRTDEEFGKADNAALVGTTAVVALIGSRQLYVANCGDSRAVLCRNGQAIPLTDDHKAAREDETARVEAAGGHILYWNGVRVMGVLAVSRAIGDHCLRPFVIAQPEVTILVRRPDDEILLLASDGLWDVLNNQEACTLAKRCLRRARQRGASRQSAARIAATVLTRAAVDRGSRDNVTVLVVDLAVGAIEMDDISRTQSTAATEQGNA